MVETRTIVNWEECPKNYYKLSRKLLDYCDMLSIIYENPEAIKIVSNGILNLFYLYQQKYDINDGELNDGYELYVDGSGNIFNKNRKRGNALIRMYYPYSDLRCIEQINDADNNEAELRAILIGIRFMKKRGLLCSKIYSDTNLVKSINNRKLNKKVKFRRKDYLELIDQIVGEIGELDYEIIQINSKEQKAHIK